MKKIKEEFDVLENELNKMLYYNYEDVYGIKSGEEIDKLETKAFEKGAEKGKQEGKLEKETELIINMLKNDYTDKEITTLLNISIEELNNIKEKINN